MTVKDLTENYTEGIISIFDSATSEQACTCNAQSIILTVLAGKTVVEWKSVQSSKAKIQITVDFS